MKNSFFRLNEFSSRIINHIYHHCSEGMSDNICYIIKVIFIDKNLTFIFQVFSINYFYSPKNVKEGENV